MVKRLIQIVVCKWVTFDADDWDAAGNDAVDVG